MKMKKFTMLLVVVSVIALGIGIAIGSHHAIKIQDKAGIGKYLTDTEGKTLYWFTKDALGKSSCNGPCLEKWPIYYRDKVAAPKGIKGKDFGTITRDDGKKQTTFRGYPIYYWVNDKQAGETSGQGVNDVWYVFNPDNFPPTK